MKFNPGKLLRSNKGVSSQGNLFNVSPGRAVRGRPKNPLVKYAKDIEYRYRTNDAIQYHATDKFVRANQWLDNSRGGHIAKAAWGIFNPFT